MSSSDSLFFITIFLILHFIVRGFVIYFIKGTLIDDPTFPTIKEYFYQDFSLSKIYFYSLPVSIIFHFITIFLMASSKLVDSVLIFILIYFLNEVFSVLFITRKWNR